MEQVKEYILNGLRFTEDQVLLFDKGIPGFEHLRRFVVSTNSDHEPFHWLHCVDDEQVRFVIINPMLFLPDYSPRITKEHLQDLHVAKKEDLLLYVIVTLHQRIDLSTANLSGPILINIGRKLGKQLILDDSRYSVKEPIIRR